MTENKNLKTIKDFLIEYKTQDNRGTAFPIYYTILDYEKEFIPSDSGEPFIFSEDGLLSYEEYCKDNENIDPEKFLSLPGIYYGEMRQRSFQRGIFLTESDAEEHLKANHYHYSEKAHTYVCHAWRAPKLKTFLEALMAFFDINKGEEDELA